MAVRLSRPQPISANMLPTTAVSNRASNYEATAKATGEASICAVSLSDQSVVPAARSTNSAERQFTAGKGSSAER